MLITTYVNVENSEGGDILHFTNGYDSSGVEEFKDDM